MSDHDHCFHGFGCTLFTAAGTRYGGMCCHCAAVEIVEAGTAPRDGVHGEHAPQLHVISLAGAP